MVNKKYRQPYLKKKTSVCKISQCGSSELKTVVTEFLRVLYWVLLYSKFTSITCAAFPCKIDLLCHMLMTALVFTGKSKNGSIKIPKIFVVE